MCGRFTSEKSCKQLSLESISAFSRPRWREVWVNSVCCVACATPWCYTQESWGNTGPVEFTFLNNWKFLLCVCVCVCVWLLMVYKIMQRMLKIAFWWWSSQLKKKKNLFKRKVKELIIYRHSLLWAGSPTLFQVGEYRIFWIFNKASQFSARTVII